MQKNVFFQLFLKINVTLHLVNKIFDKNEVKKTELHLTTPAAK